MSTYLRYALMRITLFVLVFLILYLVGARDVLLVVLAALISMALSYVLMNGMRDRVVEQLEARRTRPDHRTADEVDEDEALDSPSR